MLVRLVGRMDEYHTSGGFIAVSFTVENHFLNLRITIPKEVELVVEMPEEMQGQYSVR